MEAFDILDEQHTSKYFLDQEHLLLRSIARDNLQAPAGWRRELGKGRFCYLSPGHTPEALNHPNDATADPQRGPMGRVVAKLTYSGTHRGELFGIPATGKRVAYDRITIFRISGGKIVEGCVLGDTPTLIRQLENA